MNQKEFLKSLTLTVDTTLEWGITLNSMFVLYSLNVIWKYINHVSLSCDLPAVDSQTQIIGCIHLKSFEYLLGMGISPKVAFEYSDLIENYYSNIRLLKLGLMRKTLFFNYPRFCHDSEQAIISVTQQCSKTTLCYIPSLFWFWKTCVNYKK